MPIEAPRTERRLLGGAVRRLREAHEIKQDTLALASGINPSYLSKLERNHQQPSLAVIAKIAANLKVDIDDISYLTTVIEVTDEVAS